METRYLCCCYSGPNGGQSLSIVRAQTRSKPGHTARLPNEFASHIAQGIVQKHTTVFVRIDALRCARVRSSLVFYLSLFARAFMVTPLALLSCVLLRSVGCLVWLVGWMDGWIGRTNERPNERTNVCLCSNAVLAAALRLRAHCQLPLFYQLPLPAPTE